MAKITRKTQKIFGSSAGGTGITEYGSPAGGTPAYSTDPDEIQTASWLIGWAAAALAGTEIPTFQDFNGIHFVATRQIAYLLQEGIPEWDTGTEYHQYSVVKKTGTYELYGSKTNTNTGNALPSATDNTDWQYLGNLAALINASANVFATTYFHARCERASSTPDGNATSGSWQDRLLNVEVTDSASSGAELNTSTGVITLQTGTYIIRSSCPCYQTDGHQSKLLNVTDTADEIIGTTAYAQAAGAGYTRSDILGILVVTGGPKDFKLQTRVQTTATNGHGTSISWGTNVYSEFESWKIA